MQNDTYAMTELNVINAVTYEILASSVGRAYILYNSRSQVQTSIFLFFFLFFLFLKKKNIVILDHCTMDYKVFIFRNNILIYLSRMESFRAADDGHVIIIV